MEARSFALSSDSPPLIADMATVVDVSWDLILRVEKGRGPLSHGRESGMDEGQCWEVKGGAAGKASGRGGDRHCYLLNVKKVSMKRTRSLGS